MEVTAAGKEAGKNQLSLFIGPKAEVGFRLGTDETEGPMLDPLQRLRMPGFPDGEASRMGEGPRQSKEG